MRFCLFLALPLAVVLTACGNGHRSTSVARTGLGQKACSLHLYFATNATHGQEQAVRATLHQDSRVQQLVFTSKAQALAEFKRSHPQLFKGLKTVKGLGNPLPDSFTVIPVRLSDLPQIHSSLASRHWPGVETLRFDPCRRPRS